jgi:hypothetical protein
MLQFHKCTDLSFDHLPDSSDIQQEDKPKWWTTDKRDRWNSHANHTKWMQTRCKLAHMMCKQRIR